MFTGTGTLTLIMRDTGFITVYGYKPGTVLYTGTLLCTVQYILYTGGTGYCAVYPFFVYSIPPSKSC